MEFVPIQSAALRETFQALDSPRRRLSLMAESLFISIGCPRRYHRDMFHRAACHCLRTNDRRISNKSSDR